MDIVWEVVVYSCAQAAVSTLLSLVIAFCFLPLVHAAPGMAQRFILGLLVLMSMVSTTLVALCVQHLYGSGMSAIIITHVLINAPFALYMLYTAYEGLDVIVLDAARDLGATRWHLFTTLIVPCMRSAIIASAGIIFVLCFSSFSPIKVLATQEHHQTLTMLISHAYKRSDMHMMWLCMLARMVVIVPILVARSVVAPRVSAHIVYPMQKMQRRLLIKRIAAGVLCALMVCAQRSFGVSLCELYDVVHAVCGVSWWQIIGNTALVAVVSSVGSVAIGSLLCWYMWRSERSVTHAVCMVLALLPMVLGGLATAWCCKLVCASASARVLIIISQIFLHYPFAFRMINTQMSTYSDEWRLHAYSMGATWWQFMCTIWAPFCARSMSRGLLLTFGLSLTDAGLMSVLSDSSESTLAMIIHQMRDAGFTAHALALSACTQLFFLVMTLLW